MKKAQLLLAVVLSSWPFLPYAAQDSKELELATRVYDVMHYQYGLEVFIREYYRKSRDVPGENEAEILRTNREQTIEVLAETYTKEELSALLKFYDSDFGQTLLRKSQSITQRLGQIAQESLRAGR